MSDLVEKPTYSVDIVTEPQIEGMGQSAFKLAFSKKWWQEALKFVWVFKKHTYKPALLLALGEICAVLSCCEGHHGLCE